MKQLQIEHNKLMKYLDEDEKWMWKSWDYIWTGKQKQADYIDNRIRPPIKAKIRRQAGKALNKLEQL